MKTTFLQIKDKDAYDKCTLNPCKAVGSLVGLESTFYEFWRALNFSHTESMGFEIWDW